MKKIFFYYLLICTLSVYSQEVIFKPELIERYKNGVDKYNLTLQANDSIMKQIAFVEYNLDGTIYKEPVRKIESDSNNYQITLFGFKKVEVNPIVHFKDGSSQTFYQSLTPKEEHFVRLDNISQRIAPNKWQWQAFIVGAPLELDSIDHVEYTLHESFREPIQLVYKRGVESNRGFVLNASGWGTFVLKAKVFYRNGKKIDLEHQLNFSND
jgi:hypothetical protein